VNEVGGQLPSWAFWGAALLLFLVQFALSVAIVSVNSLSRVALHRMSAELGPRLAFLAGMQETQSTHRLAASLLRQLSLLGATLLVVLGAESAGWSYPTVFGVAVACLLGVLLFDAALARSLALWDSRRSLRATAFLVRLARVLLFPLVVPLGRILKVIGDRPPTPDEQREEEQEEEVEALIEVGEREGLLEAAEGAMMRGIVDLDETRAREIMTPRIDIIALPADSTVAQARRRLLDAGHSRLPVYRDKIDNVVGVLHARDLFQAWEDGKEQAPVTDYLRPVIHVPEQMSAADLLAEMRTKTKIALVVDEFGGLSGLVTLEDLLEEIVGEIRDEHEQEEEDAIQQQPDGSYIVQAVTHVEDLEDLFDVDFGERDFDTVGGLVVSKFGRVPLEGETIEVQGLRIRVLQAGRRRILRVRIEREPPPQQAEGRT